MAGSCRGRLALDSRARCPRHNAEGGFDRAYQVGRQSLRSLSSALTTLCARLPRIQGLAPGARSSIWFVLLRMSPHAGRPQAGCHQAQRLAAGLPRPGGMALPSFRAEPSAFLGRRREGGWRPAQGQGVALPQGSWSRAPAGDSPLHALWCRLWRSSRCPPPRIGWPRQAPACRWSFYSPSAKPSALPLPPGDAGFPVRIDIIDRRKSRRGEREPARPSSQRRRALTGWPSRVRNRPAHTPGGHTHIRWRRWRASR